MDLGLTGRKAIVCASSRGLGKACATALAREGCDVVINGLDKPRLEGAAEEIRAGAPGVNVEPINADITTEAGRKALIAACPDADILVNNNAGPEPTDAQHLSHDDWIRAFEAHFLSAVELMKVLVPGMRQRKFGRIVNITSALVKAPSSGMGLSVAPRTALTAFCKSLSHDVAPDNVTINNLLPQRIDTDRQRFMAGRMMKRDGITLEEARRRISDTVSAKRMGTAEEFGASCAFLCSVQASFISGQNLQIDGGSYRGLI